MAQSARLRRRSGRSDQGKGSRKRSSQTKQPSRAAKKRKNNYEEEGAGGAEEELFKVEKIVDSKVDKSGFPLYKTRWKGYSAGDDTWEPRENVASTGHIDRYERQQRQRTLKKSNAGVAVIEYEDGEREMIDMKKEKFRGYRPDSSDDGRDDDTVDGDDDVNNFTLVAEGKWIEILWQHTNMYFPCKIIYWAPLRAKKKHKKNSLRKASVEDGEESSRVQSKQKNTKRTSKKSKRGEDATSRGQREIESVVIDTPAKSRQPGLKLMDPTQQMFWKNESERMESMHKTPAQEEDHNESDDISIKSESSGLSDDVESHSDRHVERVGQGIPLFDEPEDDFDSSEDDSDDDEEGDETNTDQYPIQHKGPQLSFEELWALKLKRTQELIDNVSNVSCVFR